MNLLFLAHRIPYPPNKGDKLRAFHAIRCLAQQHQVHLACFADDPADRVHAESLRRYCASVTVLPLSRRWRTLVSASGLLHGRSLSEAYYDIAAMHQAVAAIAATQPLDRVLAYSGVMALFRPGLAHLPWVIDFVDLDSDKWRQFSVHQRWPWSWVYRREADTLLRFERSAASWAKTSVFVTEAELTLFRQQGAQGQLVAIANGVDSDYFQPAEAAAQEPRLVFTGAMDYLPNADAVIWFVEKVFPQLRARYPALAFDIVGAKPAAAVQALAAQPGVTVTGRVADVRPYLQHAQIAVAPLRIARGIQNKVLEAMAAGLPVVASAEAAAGLDLQDGVEALLAQEPADWVRVIATLLDTPAQRRDIGLAARQRVLRDFSWDRHMSQLEQLLVGI